jgi:hypothetical protein
MKGFLVFLSVVNASMNNSFGFESGTFSHGWIQEGCGYSTVVDRAYNPFSGDYSLLPYSGTYQGMLGYTGPGYVNEHHDAIVRLETDLPPCGTTIVITYRTYRSYAVYFEYEATLESLHGNTLATLFSTKDSEHGIGPWSHFSCTLCSGVCKLPSTFVDDRVRVCFKTSRSSNAALFIDNVSFISAPQK